jgi:prophage regulatory protein
MQAKAPTFIRSAELDERGPYQRERRRMLEVRGLYPPRIKLNCRTNVWVRTEVEAWERAKAAGATDDQVRELIRRLVAERSAGMPEAKAAA